MCICPRFAAAFTFSREQVIPDMFRRRIASLAEQDPAAWAEASRTARKCLEARIALWDAIANVM